MITNETAKTAITLHRLLENVQASLDALQNTSVYSHNLKKTANLLRKEVDASLATWYGRNLEKGETQEKYLKEAKAFDDSLTALLNLEPHFLIIVPALLKALKNKQIVYE